MERTPILITQLKKLSPFIYLLLFLFIVNIVFKLNFRWEGMSIIVNIYLYVFAFYIVFIFAMVDIVPLKKEYRELYGGKGDLILFMKTRVLPFVFIYFVTVLYTLINHLDRDYWPYRPFMELLDGRYSNILFYSIILLIILKLRREPRITIPLFIAGAVLYFVVYELIYAFDPSGKVILGLKFMQVVLALFFLVFEFMQDNFLQMERSKIFKSITSSILVGAVLYSSFLGVHYAIYRYSAPLSYSKIKSSQILMKLGFSFPLPVYRSIVLETSNPLILYELIYYSDHYNQELKISSAEWENLMLSGSMVVANIIAAHLIRLNVDVSYLQIISYAERCSIESGDVLLTAAHFTEYSSRFYDANQEDIEKRFQKGNRDYRIWLIRVMSFSKNIKAMPFLMRLLTGIDYRQADEAYQALSVITGTDPAKELKLPVNSKEVIARFNEFYLNYGKKR